jgi:NAD(P)-dependent dehydrogenase (short-subunit alcohol dehydrogenase family)
MTVQRLRFTDDDLRLFSDASHDRNPLHLSDEYARRTAFGEPIVFGALGALAMLSRLERHPELTARRLVFEFNQAAFKDVDYRIDAQHFSDEHATLGLYDGARPTMRGTVGFTSAAALSHPRWEPPRGAPAPLSTPSDPSLLQRGVRADGEYAPEPEAFAALIDRFGLTERPVSAISLAVLLWASYLTGMELPGKRALLSRLSVDLEVGALPASGPIRYHATVLALDPITNLLRTRVLLGPAEAPWGRSELRAFVRHPAHELAKAAAVQPPSGAASKGTMAGKVALIFGAGRGLGAAVATALGAEGCRVLAVARGGGNESACAAVASGRPGAAEIIPLSGDAADPSFCAATAERVRREYGRLDFLFCHVAPPLRPLWLDPEAVGRIVDHVAESVAMAAHPLTSCLPLVESSGGYVVFSSTLAVVKPRPEWPHYVAAKLAVEGLVAAAVTEFPGVTGLIVRYPRLLTDYVTHFSGERATPPAQVLTRLVERLHAPPAPGQCELLEIE